MSSDYTAHDAKRLLAMAISEDQMCGHCTGDCGACQGDAEEIIADVRADAWDEGYETGCSSPYGTATPSGKSYDPEPNPHRER